MQGQGRIKNNSLRQVDLLVAAQPYIRQTNLFQETQNLNTTAKSMRHTRRAIEMFPFLKLIQEIFSSIFRCVFYFPAYFCATIL